MRASLSASQGSLIGLGGASGQQGGAIVELYFLHSAVRIVGCSGNGDVRESRRSCGCETDVLPTSRRRCDSNVGRGLIQRVVLAEVPYLLAGIYLWLLANPVAFIFKLYKPYFNTVITWSPDVQFSTAETVIVANDLVGNRAAVVLDPRVQCWLHAAPVVGCSLDMQ